MPSLREGLLLRKYGSHWGVIQALFEIPANTVIEVEYNPPTGFGFIPVFSSQGYVETGAVKLDIYVDGEQRLSGTYSTAAWNHWMFEYPNYVVRKSLFFRVTNVTDKTQQIDFYMQGPVIPESNIDDVLDEIMLDRHLEELRKTNILLEEISKKLGVEDVTKIVSEKIRIKKS